MHILPREQEGGTIAYSPAARRVAIVFWEGHLSIAPSMMSAIQVLAEAGYEVDVLVRGADEELPPIGALPRGVRILKAELAGRISSETARKPVPARLGTMLGSLLFLLFVRREMRHRTYDAVFGVDAVGGAIAEWIASRRKVPFFYWSLELTFARDSKHPLKRVLKYLERRASRRASRIIVQDGLREQALLDEQRPGHRRILRVPNAPVGAGCPRSTRYLNRSLSIPNDALIVLHAGMLDPEVLAFELAASAKDWPEPYRLVLHSNFWKPLADPYLRSIAELREPRLYLSNQPVPLSDLDELIASAHIGLATYRDDLGPNYSLIVSASGKIPYYLRNGVPVICSDLPGMRELMTSYGCGIAVKSVAEIPRALETITAGYGSFRAGALRCYRERYDFSVHFAPVLAALPSDRPLQAAAWK